VRAERSPKKNGAGLAAPAGVRCGIYTRKSTDEGLDQAFNTLDAQREAAESFINSQRQEGWVVGPSFEIGHVGFQQEWTPGKG
jgi:hypothetical protein